MLESNIQVNILSPLVTSSEPPLAGAAVVTRVHIALVNLLVTESPGVPGIAVTREVVDAVHTSP